MKTKGVITINGIPFVPNPACNYKYDYVFLAKAIHTPADWPTILPGEKITDKDMVEAAVYRDLVLNDLWFILYFVLDIKVANHPFMVDVCRKIETGPPTMTLDIWSRGHGKTSIISIAETIQYHLKYPERCSLILSYKKGLAEKMIDSIKMAYESDFLKSLFPDILHSNPQSQANSWSTLNGLTIKRRNKTRKEPTVAASGLVEGMAQGFHCERLIFDDFETEDMANSPDVLESVYSKFQMAQYLTTKSDYDVQRVIGTIYSHLGPIMKIKDLLHPGGNPLYTTRIIPATEDGAFNGKPVFWSQEILDLEKLKPHYAMQCLCSPTPPELRKLHSSDLSEVDLNAIPKNVIKFLLIDQAGEFSKGKGDSWSIILFGVEPNSDSVGASNVYIMDAVITPMDRPEAIESVVRMYLKWGVIQAIGIEKVGNSSDELHIQNALSAHGRRVSVEEGTLIQLRPAGRNKEERIIKALAWPLSNGKMFMSKSIYQPYRQRIKNELDTFPFGKKDALDTCSYLYDVLIETDFSHYSNNVFEFRYPPQEYRLPTVAG